MDSLSQKMQQPVSQMITIKGQRLRVTIRPGNGTQTPLLLMNGLGARLEVFQSFIDELDPSLEVISFDVPGMGDSPAPVIPYHLTSLACLVASMLDKLGYKQVDVLGLSWGGWLAQQFAFQYSMRCRRLILACTGPGTLMVPGDPKGLVRLLTLLYFIDPYYIEKTAPEEKRGPQKAAVLQCMYPIVSIRRIEQTCNVPRPKRHRVQQPCAQGKGEQAPASMHNRNVLESSQVLSPGEWQSPDKDKVRTTNNQQGRSYYHQQLMLQHVCRE